MSGKPWTQQEITLLRELYATHTAAEVADRLGRSLSSTYNHAASLGLRKVGHNRPLTPAQQVIVRVYHAAGYCDREIAQRLGVERRWFSEKRLGMGLASNALSERRRRQVADKTRQQIQAAGVSSLAEIRVKAYRQFARKRGWPEDLRPRAVLILDVLYEQGAMTRREIAEAVGMPWKGSRKSLCSNDPEGSYLAHLTARGFVSVAKRGRRVHGRGKSLNTYSVTPGIIRGKESTWPKEKHSPSAAPRRNCPRNKPMPTSCAKP